MTTTFSELMAGLTRNAEGGFSVEVPASWMQGRTLYGGLSAALCLEAIHREIPDLPPLRSAQVSFIGPSDGMVSVRVTVLRQGRSVTFVAADLHAAKGLAVHTVYCFGAERASMFDADYLPMPNVPGPAESPPFFAEGFGPQFAANYEARLARGGRPVSASTEHDHFLWVRHREDHLAGPVALVALGDMPPPAVLPMFSEPAPISSMTWMFNVLTPHPESPDGWWLLRSCAEDARSGYSSQDMFIWNSAGVPVVTGRQSVAVFA